VSGPARSVSRVSAAALSGGSGDPDLRSAADVIATGARAMSGTWSRTIPGSIGVRMDGMTAIIAAGAPVARPAEYRLRHPLFGNRDFWYGPPGQPFLSPAAIAGMDAAMAKYAVKLDRLAAEAGYR